MRAKPPPATFSSKALSFYSNEHNQFAGSGNPILIKSTDKANFATHDHQLTTNREERTGREEDREITMHGLRNQATTKSVSNGTLSQLLQSLKQTRMDPNMPQMPNKQSKKYHIDLGQNVSHYPPLLPLQPYCNR